MLSWEMAPFSAAFALILLFLLLELLTLLFGSSLIGLGGDADIDVPDIDAPGLDSPDADPPDLGAGDAAGSAGGLLSWLGLGEAPFMVWLVALLLGFGITGYAGQLLAREVLGAAVSPWLVAAGALAVGLTVAKRFSRAMANLLPRVQTEAVSEGRLGGRVGVVTVGTARAGRPAEAKVTDHFGNIHYIRVVPLKAGDELPAGTEIAVMRGKNRIYRAMRLNK
ncbi:MAG: OB-fold-containig protein [Alphaproteobacteria bacterium]